MKFYCIKCKNNITDDEYFFSKKQFGKPLCRPHQPTHEVQKLVKKLKEICNLEIIYEGFDGYKSVDISIPDAKVDIEVDGLQHTTTKDQALRDLKRTYYSYKNDGYITLHIPNILVRDDNTIDEVAVFINNFLEENHNDLKDNILVHFLKKFFNIE